MSARSPVESFHWSACAGRMAELAAQHEFALEPGGRFFLAEGVCLRPPLVFPIPRDLRPASPSAPDLARLARSRDELGSTRAGDELARYLAGLPREPERQCLILMQAGAVSIGMFEAGEALATRSLKRYVVRGKGRAQPAYLATRGKSRYGSRLRLQNARLLIEETNEKLAAYWKEYGAPVHVFAGAPTRLWPDLFRAKTPPPFDKREPILRIPYDLPVPNTEVLLRTYRRLCFGRVETPGPVSG